MIWWTLWMAQASGTTRERALDISAEFATHQWTMTAVNESASCSDDYQSDFTAGTWVGIPYDWGGWLTTKNTTRPCSTEMELAAIAGMGSCGHGGVDCSGFVSQAWETNQKYGTSTIHQISEEIPVSDLRRADALNQSGSHIVLFAHQSDAGIPIHYETNGDVVFVDSDQGWSAFSDYTAIRADHIEEGPSTGTMGEPIEIEQFPYSDLRWTAGAASDDLDRYSCAPDTDESGPEMLYTFSVAEAGTLRLTVSDDDGVDVDLHLLDGPTAEDCLVRDDSAIEQWIDPGVYWISIDTYVGGNEFPGPYLLSGSFTGSLGDPPIEDESDSPNNDPASENESLSPPHDLRGPPGTAVPLNDVRACSTTGFSTGAISWLWAWVGLLWWRRAGGNGAE